jgi:hypothetical protein
MISDIKKQENLNKIDFQKNSESLKTLWGKAKDLKQHQK